MTFGVSALSLTPPQCFSTTKQPRIRPHYFNRNESNLEWTYLSLVIVVLRSPFKSLSLLKLRSASLDVIGSTQMILRRCEIFTSPSLVASLNAVTLSSGMLASSSSPSDHLQSKLKTISYGSNSNCMPKSKSFRLYSKKQPVAITATPSHQIKALINKLNFWINFLCNWGEEPLST